MHTLELKWDTELEHDIHKKACTRRISGNDYHQVLEVAAVVTNALEVCREMDEALFGEFKGEVVADLEDLIHLLGETDGFKVPVQLCLIS